MATHLWLLRHGDAEEHGTRPDAERRLTELGARQARAAGAALARRGVRIDVVLTSPRVRAYDTAKLASAQLDAVEPLVHEPLSAGFDGGQALELLREHGADAHVMIVGHEPDFSRTIADLTGARVDIKKGGLALVRVTDGGELLALLRPSEIELIADV
jgi:phosphohistidine phosphatase